MEPIGAWTRSAACTGLDPDMFFSEQGSNVALARAICAGCLVEEPCLEWGLHHEDKGIWGGTTPQERRVLRKQRGIVLDPGDDFGGPWFEVVGHGTVEAYKRHHEAGEIPCDACRWANSQAQMRRAGAA